MPNSKARGRGKGTTGGNMDAIRMLESQHRAVERLFEDLSREPDGRDLRPSLLELADLLTSHAAIEEHHFYPAVSMQDSKDLVDESYDEHLEVKRLTLHLLDAGPSDAEFAAKLEELQGLVEDHVEKEENDLFPMARELLGTEQLMAMAQEMAATLVELQEEGAPHQQLVADVAQEDRRE
jgi:hemerythrin-like domain-containing protein